ncbi:ABC transporter permease [Thermomonospora umbrina]|uniref:ABC-2 family transporter n=1 Tax=Thermomonospora umbrina TaxID=111806 RepID=A0A3D9SY32_9ACTN|nr:ABC transporter permease [Thermomonospora umbrina]REE96521.1 hypothetical protein DFJ69_1958 [Thermomonospora umbrina]
MTVSAPRAGFRHLLAAEWTKLWSLRSTYGVLVTGTLVTVGICVNSARSNVDLIRRSGDPASQAQAIDPMHGAFVPDAFLIFMIITGSVGAIAVFGEYASGLIRTTFAAVPARRQVVAAKVAVVSAVMLAFGTVVAASSFGLTQAVYHREHIGLSITAPGAFRAVAASALLAPVCALVGMALGAVIRHAAGTVVAVVVVLGLLPRLFEGETYRWVKEIGNAMPLSAWEALVENTGHVPPPDGPIRSLGGRYPVTITEAWVVFGAWALAAVAVTVIVVHRRDV